jgi:hypothetical protein
MPNPSLIASDMTDEEYQQVIPEVAITQKALQEALEAHQTQETSGLVSQTLQAKEEASDAR